MKYNDHQVERLHVNEIGVLDTERIPIANVAEYKTAYTVSDLTDDSLVPLRVLLSLIPNNQKGLTVPNTDTRMSYNAGQWIFTYDNAAVSTLGTDEPFDNFILNGQSVNVKPGYTYDGSGNIATIYWDGAFSGSEVFKVKLLNY